MERNKQRANGLSVWAGRLKTLRPLKKKASAEIIDSTQPSAAQFSPGPPETLQRPVNEQPGSVHDWQKAETGSFLPSDTLESAEQDSSASANAAAAVQETQALPQTWALPQQPVVVPFDKKDYRTLSVLLNGFKATMGEPALTHRQWATLHTAVDEDQIAYYIALYEGKAVGLCSLSLIFSSGQCAPYGVFSDFYVRPEAHSSGAAQALVTYARSCVRQAGGHALTVTCVSAHAETYRNLGFREPLGAALSMPAED